jgi:hypothetical protein
MGDCARLRAHGPFAACVLGAVLSISFAMAEGSPRLTTWLTAGQISDEFSGRRLEGTYPSGVRWSEHIAADGSTDYVEGDKRWRGVWWLEERAFCFSYPPPGIGGCFRVRRSSENCFDLYEVGIADAQGEDAPLLPDRWNGRMWHGDRPLTCEAAPTT